VAADDGISFHWKDYRVVPSGDFSFSAPQRFVTNFFTRLPCKNLADILHFSRLPLKVEELC
jgi:hypothetical protein